MTEWLSWSPLSSLLPFILDSLASGFGLDLFPSSSLSLDLMLDCGFPVWTVTTVPEHGWYSHLRLAMLSAPLAHTQPNEL